VPLSWIKRSYEDRYATLPSKGQGGYRPKPPPASDPPPPAQGEPKVKKLRKDRSAEDGGSRKDRHGHEARKSADANGAEARPPCAPPVVGSKEPSKKQLHKKRLREKKKAASGTPELTAERFAAYTKLKPKKKREL
jgi:hypothetical protein